MAGETFLPDLVTRMRLDTTDIDAGVGRAAALGGAIGGAFGGLVASGVQEGIAAVTDFVGGSVGKFSQLEDSTAAASVIFGDSMDQIIAQSKTATSSLGLNSGQVIEAANTFGTYGKSANLAGGDLAKFSTDMTALAGDMASFKGKSPEEAIQAIGSALRGENEPIRAFGVLLDDATLKSRALALGIGDGTSALTPQQKVLAAQAEILAQTTDAQGDYARTIDSTANVSNRFANTAADLQAKLGGLLAPAFTAAKERGIEMMLGLSGALDTWVPKITAFHDNTAAALGGVRDLFTSGDYTGAIGDALSGMFGDTAEDSAIVDVVLTIREAFESFAAFIGPVLAPIGATFGAVFGALGTSIGPLVPQLVTLAQSFSPVGVVLQSLGAILPSIAGLITTVISSLGGALGAILPPLIAVGQTISNSLVGALVFLAPVIAQVAGVLAGVLGQAVASLAPVIASLVPVVGQIASVLAITLGNVIAGLAPVLLTLVGAFASLLPSVVGLAGPLLGLVGSVVPVLGVVGQLVSTLVGALAPVIVQLAGLFVSLLPAVLSLVAPLLSVVTAVLPLVGVLGDLIGAILPPLIALFMAVLTPVIELAGVLAEALAPVITLVAQLITTLLVPIVSALASWMGTLIGVVTSFTGPVLGALVGVIAVVVGAIARAVGAFATWLVSIGGVVGAVKTMASVVGDAIGSVVSWFAGLPGRTVDAIGDLAGRLAGAGRDIIDGFLRGLREGFDKVKDFVGGIGTWIADHKGPRDYDLALLQPAGGWLMQGLTTGMQRGMPQLGRQLQSVADLVGATRLPALSVDTAALGAVGANAAPVNYNGGALGAQPAPVSVRVYLGNEELTDRVRVVITDTLDAEARAMSYGSTD